MPKYLAFSHTETGITHKKPGREKPCQDSSFSTKDHHALSVAIVADGHGDENCFRSTKGSELAVEAAKTIISAFIKPMNEGFDPAKGNNVACKYIRDTLIPSIISAWIDQVAKHFSENPFTEEELKNTSSKYRKRYEEARNSGSLMKDVERQDYHHAYGSTLIAAVITPRFWFGVHVGDGRFTVLNTDGSYDQPVPWDDKCDLNVTTSICDVDAADRARFCFSFIDSDHPAPLAVFVCSDGIDDNYPVDDNAGYLFRKVYRPIVMTFKEDGFDSTIEQLKKLIYNFANEGKGDDTSLAGFIDMEALGKAYPVWQKQAAEEKVVDDAARAEAQAKKEAATKAADEARAKKEAAKAAEEEAQAMKEAAAQKEAVIKDAIDVIKEKEAEAKTAAETKSETPAGEQDSGTDGKNDKPSDKPPSVDILA